MTRVLQPDATGKRLESLDGIRAIAIFVVIGYHFFSSSLPVDAFGSAAAVIRDFPLFRYGNYGVQLFFIVSGFVISMTLRRCATGTEFFVRRFARLWPPMLLCSALTFLVVKLAPATGLGTPFSVSWHDFMPSLLFIEPAVFNALFASSLFQSMDGAYWSLYVEVRFYVLALACHFLLPGRFARNIFGFAVLTIGLSLVLKFTGQDVLRDTLSLALITPYMPWFLMGIGWFSVEAKEAKAVERREGYLLFWFGITAHTVAAALRQDWAAVVVGVLAPALFVGAFRIRLIGSALAWQPLAAVGAASYSLYLFHQVAGISLTRWIASEAELGLAGYVLAAMGIALAFAALSLVSYRHFELPLNKVLVALYLSKAR